MNDRLQATYDRLAAEALACEERARVLRNQMSALEEAGANPAPANAAATPTPYHAPNGFKSHATGPQRAPTGELPRVILATLKQEGPLTNAQIRTKLQQSGYQWALTPLHVSKTLTKLHRTKKVKSDGPPNNRTYRVP